MEVPMKKAPILPLLCRRLQTIRRNIQMSRSRSPSPISAFPGPGVLLPPPTSSEATPPNLPSVLRGHQVAGSRQAWAPMPEAVSTLTSRQLHYPTLRGGPAPRLTGAGRLTSMYQRLYRRNLQADFGYLCVILYLFYIMLYIQ